MEVANLKNKHRTSLQTNKPPQISLMKIGEFHISHIWWSIRLKCSRSEPSDFFFLFFFFLFFFFWWGGWGQLFCADMWDLSSPTRDGVLGSYSGRVESSPLDSQGSPPKWAFYCSMQSQESFQSFFFLFQAGIKGTHESVNGPSWWLTDKESACNMADTGDAGSIT